MVPELLVLALHFYREPLRFGNLTDPSLPLPEGFEEWLAAAINALAPGEIQATAAVLDTRPDELRRAFRFFLRHMLLSPRADHYRVLGLSRRCAAVSVKRHHSLLVRMYHPDRTAGEDERDSALTARINAAYEVLRDPGRRRRYDNELAPLAEGARLAIELPVFVAGRGAAPKLPTPLPRPALLRTILRRATPWTLAALGGILLAVFLLAPEPTFLRVNPERAVQVPTGPAYLDAREPAPAPARTADRLAQGAPAATASGVSEPAAPAPEQEDSAPVPATDDRRILKIPPPPLAP